MKELKEFQWKSYRDQKARKVNVSATFWNKTYLQRGRISSSDGF